MSSVIFGPEVFDTALKGTDTEPSAGIVEELSRVSDDGNIMTQPSFIIEELGREEETLSNMVRDIGNQLHRLQAEEMILRRLLQQNIWEAEGSAVTGAWEKLVEGLDEMGGSAAILRDDENDGLGIDQLNQLLAVQSAGILNDDDDFPVLDVERDMEMVDVEESDRDEEQEDDEDEPMDETHAEIRKLLGKGKTSRGRGRGRGKRGR